ncbi:hypothetical protein GCM10011396_12360 [Undibacterium terreum]|uniref:Uncharacterized protein n=1 Tax=Undibacterium terreum TaxID=1224302 RepID=A0A916XFI6_9BURK|nr:hypothetical protein GCM10011396_12360 [Undibacterium terreum]
MAGSKVACKVIAVRRLYWMPKLEDCGAQEKQTGKCHCYPDSRFTENGDQQKHRG